MRDKIKLFYDSGKFKLAHRRKLSFDEIKKQAQGYFIDKYHSGDVGVS